MIHPGKGSESERTVASQPFSKGAAGRKLRRTLASDEPVLAFAAGMGDALPVATDWRAIIIKAGTAATGSWLGQQNTSFRYGQISSIDLYMPGTLDTLGTLGTLGEGVSGVGFVVITSTGEPNPY